MSGANRPIVQIEPGIFKTGTEYLVGNRWFDGNQVRWYNNLLAPVGGWAKLYTFAATQAMRDMFSWRDYLKNPWMAVGSADKLFSLKVLGSSSFTVRDITPAGLAWSTSPMVGYGAQAYGGGPYGFGEANVNPDSTGQWSFDNFGRLLMSVHTQDGRLFSYDPVTPTVIAAPVAGAPLDNTLVLVTDERHVLLLGGKNKPRTAKWSSQEDYNDWVPTATNSAGGFELQSNGVIIAAIKLPGGILVLTDTDAHMIEYIGAPFYYSRRRITEESSIIGKNCLTAYPQGAMWVGNSNFWHYDGGVSKLECSLHNEVFGNSDLSLPSRQTLSTNEFGQEIWFSYPGPGETEPSKYVLSSFGPTAYWSLGDIPRTAWLNPCWTDRPYACNGLDLYQHEIGWLADGVSRNNKIFATSGAIEMSEGDDIIRCDRIYPDFAELETPEAHGTPDLGAATLTFKLRQAPNAPERTYGPVTLDNPKGYIRVRFRARQVAIRVNQAKDEFWVLGKMRARMKAGGKR